MIRPIVQLGDPFLKQPARNVEPGEPSLPSLVEDMLATLTESGGVGLAAPQVGESFRLILAGSFPTEQNPDRPNVPTTVLINPRITYASEETDTAWGGCLSFRQYRVRVVRSLAVKVEARSLEGEPLFLEASGFFARVLQHEIDHLDGILTLDRVQSPEDVELLN